jgi:AcrR family transcriptional regulator
LSDLELPPPPWRPARKRRAARRPLSTATIVEAALRVLRREGLDAVTMRRVAQELGAGAASLYVHVADKDELDSLMLDHVLGELRLPEAVPERWQEQLKALARDMVRVMEANMGIARVAIANPPVGANALRVTDWTLGLLRVAGASDQVAAYACDLLWLYCTSVGLEVSAYAAMGFDPQRVAERATQMRQYFASLPSDRFPNLVALAGPMTAGGGDERLEFGLDLLIGGLGRKVRQ